MFLEQRHGSARLCRYQPDGGFVLLIALDQFAEFAELVGVGRHRSAGQVEAVGMGVLLEQFRQIKAIKGFRGLIGLGDVPMQHARPEAVAFVLAEPQLSGHLLMMIRRMIQPLLSMGESVASLIDDDAASLRQVVEQRGWLIPCQSHQAPHSLRGASFQQGLSRLVSQKPFNPFRHLIPETVCDERAEAGRRQAQLLDGIQGTLAGGVELTQFVEFLSKELQTHGQFAAHREDVDDVPPPAPGPFLINGRDPFVSEMGQMFAKLLEVEFVPPFQTAALIRKRLWRWQVGLQTSFGGHHRFVGAIGIAKQVAEHLQLSPDDFAGGIERFVGRTFTRWIQAHTVPTHQVEQGRPTSRLLQCRHDDQQGASISSG